jgi:phosphatidate cytidylyltransferase
LLAAVVVLLTLAEIEFCRLAAQTGSRPELVFGLGMVWLFLLDAHFGTPLSTFRLLRPGMTLIVLLSLVWQMLHRQGSPVTDWALTMAGGLYLGVCGSHLIGMRSLQPDGRWWTMTAVAAIVAADSGAFFVGKTCGRRKLAPTLSPGKTWEGYVAGIICGSLMAALLAELFRAWVGHDIGVTGVHGLILGLVIAVIAPLGDLAVSMFKRQARVKDSGMLLPGHGGALDRMDSILWAAVIGYYYVTLCVR